MIAANYWRGRKTVARLLNSFSAGGQRFHYIRQMSDVHNQVEQYAGDNALYCMNGAHSYTNGTCAWCGRKDHTQSLPTVNN